ncbi:glycerophosphodiester phosphodiesterase [Piscinibacter sakaiensis]|uniref:glycerophosphodiester phosphodiesterase n=1 Tax=Piscinibacter sakaiensis TaxID=1547922 RepID=UPI003AADF760
MAAPIQLADWPYPRWIAHRGAGKLAPENTLAAFRLGAAFGYRAFECDVKLSADGIAFLLHDATLDRTTNGQGVAGERAWSDLSQLDAGSWHGRRDAGEPLATLEAVARYCIANGFDLNIEIKPTPGHAEATGRAVALAARQLWQLSGRKPLLSSFVPEALESAQSAVAELPRALLIDKLESDWLGNAQRLDCRAVVAHHPLIDASMIDALHSAGRRVLAYTVNETQAAQRLISLGIDGLITDAVDRFSPASDGV